MQCRRANKVNKMQAPSVLSEVQGNRRCMTKIRLSSRVGHGPGLKPSVKSHFSINFLVIPMDHCSEKRVLIGVIVESVVRDEV